jgi:hypothetical protein
MSVLCWLRTVDLVDGLLQHRFEVVPFALGRGVAACGIEEPDDGGDVGPTVERSPGSPLQVRVKMSAASSPS